MAATPLAADAAANLSLDVNGLAALKRQSLTDPRAGLKGAARQFEALFLQQVLKAMREATPQDGPFASEQTKMYQSLLDQQLATTLSAKGATGLAAMIEKQIGGRLPAEQAARPEAGASPVSRFPLDTLRAAGRQILGEAVPRAADAAKSLPASLAGGSAGGNPQVQAFVDRLWPHALEASRATGIPAHFLVGHAALETGWGRAELRLPDGSPSHNLFNVKAGKGWNGPVVEVSTTEYVNGVAQKSLERFRVYGSQAEAFADYASLLRDNPRYARVLGQRDAGGFAQGLMRAGYATDPAYADKLGRIIGGPALRRALSG